MPDARRVARRNIALLQRVGLDVDLAAFIVAVAAGAAARASSMAGGTPTEWFHVIADEAVVVMERELVRQRALPDANRTNGGST